MTKKLIFWLVLSSGMIHFYACQRRYVCPAYNSAFILDEKKTHSFFSQFGQDSLPKGELFVNKNNSGIIVKVKYQQKQKNMNSVKAKIIYPPPLDSTLIAGTYTSNVEGSEIDSAYAMAPLQKFSFNRDQEVYMRYIGPYYYRPERNVAVPQPEKVDNDPGNEEDDLRKKRRWFWNRKKTDNISIEDDEDTNVL